MKIAVASNRGVISAHFGHSEGFEVFEVEGTEISTKDFVVSPGHGKGSLPGLLISMKTDVLLAGGLGEGAVARLEEGGIKVISGVSGNTMDAVHRYMSGELKSEGSLCKGHGDHDHAHTHEGGHSCQGEGGCGSRS